MPERNKGSGKDDGMLMEMNPDIYAGDVSYRDRACVMLVCINGCHTDMIYGCIVNYYLTEPVFFEGTSQLVLGIDRICETVGAPVRTVEPRFLGSLGEGQYRQLSMKQVQMKMCDAAEYIIPYASKAKEVVIVQVLFRRNSTIQGRMHCTYGGKRYVSFRSALELMRMMEEVGADLREKEGRKKAMDKERIRDVQSM